jgi:parvulin-like peptidyl-prolyl isomerase
MTFRARTAQRPTRRRTNRSDTRRAVWMTVSFSLAIACALSLMGGVFVAGYYRDHGAPIASVNGEAISKDAVRARAKVDLARYERRLVQDQQMRNQGKITTDEYATLQSAIQTSESTVNTDALTELINEAEIRHFAAKNNISVSDQQIADQIKTDSTLPEMRHVKIISVPVEALPPATSPTQADSDRAEAAAKAYLAEIQGGKAWDDVAKEADTKSKSSNSGGGDLGNTSKAAMSIDPDIADAIFALAKAGDITPIMKGVNGAFRFATVTSIVPSWVDNDWQSSVGAASSDDGYREFARNEAINRAVEDWVDAKYVSGQTVQRDVREIQIRTGFGQVGDGDEVKISIMIFAPGHATANASTDTDTKDAAWTDALSRANAVVATLRADPSKFAATATDTKTNDDPNFATMAGDLPWIPADWFNATTKADPSTGQTNSGLGMTTVAAAVFKDGLAAGTILDPVLEPASGYVVVYFQGRRPAPAQRIANALWAINNGTDFEAEARLSSESADAINGGSLGWVSPYMLTKDQQQAVYSTPVGRVSNIVEVNASSYYLYKVVSEQTRVADPAQQAKLKKVVYSSWLNELQANALVWKDDASVTVLSSASPGQ